MKGIFLGIHCNSPADHFVVLGFVRGNEYPPINVTRTVTERQKLTIGSSHDGSLRKAYTKVWFQPLDEDLIPESTS